MRPPQVLSTVLFTLSCLVLVASFALWGFEFLEWLANQDMAIAASMLLVVGLVGVVLAALIDTY